MLKQKDPILRTSSVSSAFAVGRN